MEQEQKTREEALLKAFRSGDAAAFDGNPTIGVDGIVVRRAAAVNIEVAVNGIRVCRTAAVHAQFVVDDVFARDAAAVDLKSPVDGVAGRNAASEDVDPAAGVDGVAGRNTLIENVEMAARVDRGPGRRGSVMERSGSIGQDQPFKRIRRESDGSAALHIDETAVLHDIRCRTAAGDVDPAEGVDGRDIGGTSAIDIECIVD